MEQERFYSSIANYYEYIFPLNTQQVEFVLAESGATDEMYFLDIGCSTGQLANELSMRGALGIGIDLNGDMIDRATGLYSSAALSFRVMNMLHLSKSFPPGYFNTVICFGNTLVHLGSIIQIKDFLKQSASVLKPGGKLLLQLLNYDYILSQKITELPLIDNDRIRFVRRYSLPDGSQSNIQFQTELTIKSSGEVIQNNVPLLPLRKRELEKLLLLTGFKQPRFYSNFAKAPCEGDHFPLVVVAEK